MKTIIAIILITYTWCLFVIGFTFGLKTAHTQYKEDYEYWSKVNPDWKHWKKHYTVFHNTFTKIIER